MVFEDGKTKSETKKEKGIKKMDIFLPRERKPNKTKKK